MNRNIALPGGECSPQRIELSARRFKEMKGPDALAAFLHATAGVVSIEQVPPDDRFRVNRALREEVNNGSPREKLMARVRSDAFGKMVRR